MTVTVLVLFVGVSFLFGASVGALAMLAVVLKMTAADDPR